MSAISYGEDQTVASNDDRRGGRRTGASWSACSDDVESGPALVRGTPAPRPQPVAMPYSLVQPWGRDRYRDATVVGIHATVTDAYDALDAIAEKLQRDRAPDGYLEIDVVDEERQPVTRPGVQ